jgi:excinuclease UvrABC nuclease subunit
MNAKWSSYNFTIYDPAITTWNDFGGVYIFAGANYLNQWTAYYIGQTNSFQTRLPSHDRWEEARRLGATHVHALVVPQEATRLQIEQDLIQAFQPKLNQQLKEAY